MAETTPQDLPDDAGARGVGRSRLWAALTGQRVRPVWIVAAYAWVLFTVFRAGLLAVRAEDLQHANAADIAKCFLIGLWYDAMPIGYLALPMVLALLLAPNAAFRRRWFRGTITGYAAVACVLLSTTEVVGAAFYLVFDSRLNCLALAHLGTFREPGLGILKAYPVWLLVVGVGLGLYLLVKVFGRAFWRGRCPEGPLWPRPIVLSALVGLAVLGCRGSFRRPLLFGPSYFCDNKVLAQLTLNNIFTLSHAVRTIALDNLNDDELYPLPDPRQAEEVVKQMVFQAGDRPLGSPRNPLWRLTDTGRPKRDLNVVVIVMEGMAGEPVGALGYPGSQTPCFDRLCRESLFFDRLYAVGDRTSRGMVGVLCAHPDLAGGLSLIKRWRAQGNCFTLPGVFSRRGYRTCFIYGGDPDFDNMKRFFQADGMETFVCEEQMGPSELRTEWGYHDEIILRKAHETFLNLSGQKFFAVVLTVSNHRPFDVPGGRVEMLPGEDEANRSLNSYRYADWALGEFFRLARGAPYFKDTIFVLVSDHGRTYEHEYLFDVVGHRIPCAIYAPGIVSPRVVRTVGSQVDIAPTVLGLLGGQYLHGCMGRDLLKVPPGEGFALIHSDVRMAIIRQDRALVLPAGGQPLLYRVGPLSMEPVPGPPQQVEALQREMLCYYTMGRHLYLTCSHQDPAGAPPAPPTR